MKITIYGWSTKSRIGFRYKSGLADIRSYL